MASRPRAFEAHRLVLITFRCVLRLDMLSLEGVRELLAQQMAINSHRCQVDVVAWSMQSNHVHLLVRQPFDGHCPKGQAGIAPFIRNVVSVVARYGNARATVQGRFLERTYRSHNVGTVGDVIRFLAYIHGQALHHRVSPEAACELLASSASVLGAGEPDGLVEWLPDSPGFESLDLEARCERFRTLIGRIVDAACAEERRLAALDVPGTTLTPRQLKAMKRDAWRQAQAKIAQEFGITGLDDDSRRFTFRSLAEFVGQERVDAARERVLAFEWERSEPQPRRAPRLGQALRIKVAYSRPATPLRS